MKRTVAAVAVALAVLGGSPVPSDAKAVHDVEERPAMLGGGWIAWGDPEDKVHVQVHLLCPGSDVGFNPQPDPPKRLDLRWGSNRFSLDTVESAHCTGGGHVGNGIGSCTGGGPVPISWSLSDAALGGPDTRDHVTFRIEGSERCALDVAGPLGGGNLRMKGGTASRGA